MIVNLKFLTGETPSNDILVEAGPGYDKLAEITDHEGGKMNVQTILISYKGFVTQCT